MAGLNEKLLSKVRRVLKASEEHSEIWRKWRKKAERKEFEAKRELKEAYLENISSSPTHTSYSGRKELFQNWFRDNFLGKKYKEKIEKTSEAKDRAFDRWVEKYRKKLEDKGFTPLDRTGQMIGE